MLRRTGEEDANNCISTVAGFGTGCVVGLGGRHRHTVTREPTCLQAFYSGHAFTALSRLQILEPNLCNTKVQIEVQVGVQR
jgi:hypothetical protein